MSKKSSRRSSRKNAQSSNADKRGSSDNGGIIERTLKAVGLGFLVTASRMFSFAVRGIARSQILLTLPLVLLFTSTLTDYLVLLHATDSSALLFFSAMPVPVEDARRVGAENLKKTVQAYLYLITLGLCVLNWRAVYQYLKRWPHLVLLIGVLLFTATYSTEPSKVVTNSILILISILMPLLFVIGQRDVLNKLQVFYLMILAPFLITHLASLGLLLYYGSDPFSIMASPMRYGGFAGNPNSLGNSAVLGVWASAALLLSPSIALKWRILAGFAAPVFVCSVAMSGSGTATVASILVFLLIVWMRVVASIKPSVRLVVNVFSAALLVCLVLSVLLLVSPAEIFLVFTDSLGKDATMTGRTELWALAKDAIAERPWLGWSFDSHTSVMAVRAYDVRFNHYHNGFLDTMIEGGILLISVVLFNFGWFVARFIKVFRQNDQAYPLVVPFILMIILNMSEYSLLRPLSEVWHLYIACFVVLTYQYVDTTSLNRTSPERSRRKRSKPAMRWG